MALQSSLRAAGILGTGSYVPPRVVTNDDLAQSLDTTDEWIRTRTGIRARRVADPGVATSDLAAEAAKAALADADLSPDAIDLVIVATCTPDYPGGFPSTAAIVQNAIGARRAGAFDLSAVCSGFSYALHVGANLVRSGAHERVLVIGAETLSRVVNWEDRNTAVLFGDGAGAVVVGPTEDEGYVGGIVGADGSGACLLYVASGGSRSPLTADLLAAHGNTIFQNGKEVYRFAVSAMGDAAMEVVAKYGLTPVDVDLLIPHQANIRIIEKAAEKMGLPSKRVCVNLDKYGNTSAASIPLAMDEAARSGRIKLGDRLVLVGFGAGLAWAANVVRWTKGA